MMADYYAKDFNRDIQHSITARYWRRDDFASMQHTVAV